MNKNYDHCLEMLLEHEGGFVNHPDDPGGITNLGVTKKVYEEWVEREVSEQEMHQLLSRHSSSDELRCVYPSQPAQPQCCSRWTLPGTRCGVTDEELRA